VGYYDEMAADHLDGGRPDLPDADETGLWPLRED